MIIRKNHDSVWLTIQCPKCKDCYKVLKAKAHWQQSCPYCSELIELQELHPATKPTPAAYDCDDGRFRSILPKGGS